jgi:hypothetical protein
MWVSLIHTWGFGKQSITFTPYGYDIMDDKQPITSYVFYRNRQEDLEQQSAHE